MIVKTEQYTTGCCAAFAIDDPLEAVTILHLERRVDTTDISVEQVLRSGQKAGLQGNGSIFKSGEALFQNKAFDIIVCARTTQVPCATCPLGGTGIGNKIISDASERWRFDLNVHPEWTVGSGVGAEDLALLVSDLPVAAIFAFNDRRNEIHGDVDRLARRNRRWELYQVLPLHEIAADEGQPIRPCPCAGSVVLQPPDLREGTSRRKYRAVRDGHVTEEFDAITAQVGGRCGRLNGRAR